MKPHALIAGATGLVGNELLELLSELKYYESVHVALRRPVEKDLPGVQVHIVNFEDFSRFNPGVPIRDVYICLGTTQKKAGGKAGFYVVDHDYVLNVAKWALENKVERLCVISSVGANSKSRSFYLQTKGKVEDELIRLKFKHLCIMRPSLLLGKRQEYRWMEEFSAKVFPLVSFALVGRLKKYRAVEAEKVAHAMFRLTTGTTEPLLIAEYEKIIGS